MPFREYEEHDLPSTLVSLIETTRLRLMGAGKESARLKTLGEISRTSTTVPACLSASSLRHLLDKGDHRVRADEDAMASFKYGPWVDDDQKNQEELRVEIDKFMPGAKPSGLFWYPAGGYMGWHTNSNRPGERLFCTFVEEGGRSFFRYRDPLDGQVRTSWDRTGWTFRRFRVGATRATLLWHCVFSAIERISLGFYLPE